MPYWSVPLRRLGLTLALGFLMLAVAALALLLSGCASSWQTPPKSGPPQGPDRTLEFIATCRALYLEVLRRDPAPGDPGGLRSCVDLAKAGKTADDIRAIFKASDEYKNLPPLVPVPPPVPGGRVAGRLRATPGGFVNDAGPWRWYGRSEFDLVHLARVGRRLEATMRLDAAQAAGHTNVRVFATASILFDLHPGQAGYDEALTWVIVEANHRGLYVDLVLFCDAQLLYPKAADRTRVLDGFARRLATEPGVVVELANEPSFNGWSGATDPALLALADRWKAKVGHKDFFIGDPPDGDNLDASAKTAAAEVELAKRVNLLSIHSSRKGGAAVDGTSRLRRHVDHVESGSDLRSAARKVNPNALLVHTEPMGMASLRRVPLPNGKTYEREYDPDVVVALILTGLFTSDGITYHRIAQQDPGLPGIAELARIVPRLPVGGCRYFNDHNGGATDGFTWVGKVRSYICGTRGFVLAYGLDKVGTERNVNGWTPKATLYASPAGETGELARSKVKVFEVAR